MSLPSSESLSRHSTPIPRDPASVYAALPEDRAASFRQEWEAALDQARADLDLGALTARLKKITGDYWAVASALASPRAKEAGEEARRWREGEEIDVIPGDEVLNRLR